MSGGQLQMYGFRCDAKANCDESPLAVLSNNIYIIFSTFSCPSAFSLPVFRQVHPMHE